MTAQALSAPRRALRRWWRRPGALIGVLVVAALVVLLVGAEVIAPYGDNRPDTANRLQGPSATHWLGTDHLGRDLFSRLVYGTRVAMGVALPGVLGALAVGLSIGLVAGYVGGWLDSVVLVLLDTVQALPAVVLALAVLALLGPSTGNVIGVIIIAFAPGYARVARAQVMAVRTNQYIEAARALGASTPRILLTHALPNIIAPLLVLVAMDLPGAITFEAGLSFLGLGVRPPTPSWGVILADGFQRIRESPWAVLWASTALAVTTLGFTLFGEALRDLLDPDARR
jgi:peptide/nickel transport system permease protein